MSNVNVRNIDGFPAVFPQFDAFTRDTVKRAMADAGLTLVDGSFEDGAVVHNTAEVVLQESTGKTYGWFTNATITVPVNTTPQNFGGVNASAWIDKTNALLRVGLSSELGGLLVHGVYVDAVTVTAMLQNADVKSGNKLITRSNQRGIPSFSLWDISNTQNTNTYSLPMVSGLYANLVCEPVMNYAAFGFGGSSSENSAAIDEACRVARANTIIEELRFPTGTFHANQINLDVDRRGFSFGGPGYDMSYIYSESDNLSLVLVGLDPRDRTKDSQHFYQKIYGFTIDGNITSNGTSAAQRTAIVAPYAEINFKSVGHRVSNIDLQSLSSSAVVHTQGRTNGVVSTQNSVRARNNALDIDGYIGGSANYVSLLVHGPKTTLSTAASVNDSVINVVSSSGLVAYDTLELLGGTFEAKRIISISGNNITLDSPLVYAHSAGAQVSIPVNGVDIDAIFETGEVQIGNSAAVNINGTYAEGSKFYVFGYPNGLNISSNIVGEVNPTIQIDQVDRNSNINIAGNATSFPVTIAVKDRGGNINSNLDLYNFPLIKVAKCSRGEQSILVNSTYSFSSIDVSRTYDSILSDRAFTQLEFSGLFFSTPAASTLDAVTFGMFPALTGTNSDGYAFDVSVVCRRSTTVLAGLLKRAGTASVFSGTTPNASTTSISSNYNQYNASTGVDVTLAATAASISTKGEPSGGQTTRFSISGVITHVF